MRKEEKRKVTFKEYMTVFFMFSVCILTVFVARNWYRNYQEYNLTIPVISGKLFEISIDELDTYIMEHDDFFIYIGTSYNENCRDIETKLEKFLSEKNIKNDTIYLNMSNVNNGKTRLMSILSKYGTLNKEINYPIFLIIENKKILAYTGSANDVVNIDDIDKLLDEYEIGV